MCFSAAREPSHPNCVAGGARRALVPLDAERASSNAQPRATPNCRAIAVAYDASLKFASRHVSLGHKISLTTPECTMGP